MKVFSEYKAARQYAAELAAQCSMTAGIGKTKEFGKTVFSVRLLPRKENRAGFELTLETVEPGDPA